MNHERTRSVRGIFLHVFVILLAVVSTTTAGHAQRSDAVARNTTDDVATAEELLARRVTVTLHNVSLKRAIDSVAALGKVLVQYQAVVLQPYNAPVTVQALHLPLGAIFERLLDGTNLRVVSDGQGGLGIVSTIAPADSVAATGRVMGRVIDSATKRPVNGATVTVAGTKRSAITSDSGQFRISNVPVGDQLLVVKVFGYRPIERAVTVTLDQPVSVRIALAVAPNVLSGVLTTATGVQERRTVGSDITVLNVDSVMQTAPIRSVTDLLEGRVPGLTVQRSSGVPGAPSRLRLRGIGGGLAGSPSMSNDPIIIVDGIRVYSRASTGRDQNLAPSGAGSGNSYSAYSAPSALDQIDPNSIETIEVFKGPSASSQWGADAGNGVIVITTKRGRAGAVALSGALNFDIDQLPGEYAPPVYYRFGTAAGGGGSVVCSTGLGGGVHAGCGIVDSIVPFQALNIPRLSPFGTATQQGASVTVRGGSVVTYAITGTTKTQHGYYHMPSYARDLYSLTYSASAPSWMVHPDLLNEWGESAVFGVTLADGFRLTYSPKLWSSSQRQSSGSQTVASLSGNYIDTAGIQGSLALGRGFLGIYTHRVRAQTVTTSNDVQGDWTRWSWLPLNAIVGVSREERHDRNDVPFGIQSISEGIDSIGYFGRGDGLAVTRNGTLTGTVLPTSRVPTTFGVQITQQSTDDIQASQDSLAQGVTSPTSLEKATQSSYASTTGGWYIEPRLNVASQLFVSPGFRIDGSGASKVGGTGANGFWSLFPKLNFSWVAVDREDQRPLAGFLTLLRPRLALGVAGVQPDPSWHLQALQEDANGATIGNTLGNSQLHPERSRETEAGFDAQLWGNRVAMTVTGYYKMRSDAILSVATAGSVGAKNLYLNVGRVRNAGGSFWMQAEVVETPLVRWGVHGSFSANHNMLVSVSDAAKQLFTDDFFLHEGYPIGGVWMRPIVGYRDPNGDGRLEPADVTVADSMAYVGDGQSKYELPFGTDISLWKGRLSVYTEFNYVNGVTQTNTAVRDRLYSDFFNPHASLGEQAAALAAACPHGATEPVSNCSDIGLVQTVSTLRFNSLSVAYQVPATVTRRLRLPSVVVSAQGSNLALWTNYRGKDPDVNASTVGEALQDGGQLPSPRTWSFRVSFTN